MSEAPLIETEEAPLPDDVSAFWLEAEGKPRLRVAVLPAEAPKGTAFLLGGRTEFIEKYWEVAGEWRERGFSSLLMDWRGQGLSERALPDRRKGHVAAFGEFEDDLKRLVAWAREAKMPEPWTGMAHSMGGAVMLAHEVHAQGNFAALFLSAPMLALKLPQSGALRIAMRSLVAAGRGNGFVPGGKPAAIDEEPFAGNHVTSDRSRYARMQSLVRAEPALGLGAPTVAWLAAAFDLFPGFAASGSLEGVETPVLMGIAARDALVDNAALYAAAERLPNGRAVALASSRHEILMERDPIRQRFWQAADRLLADYGLVAELKSSIAST